MAYDVTQRATVGQLKALALRTKSEIEKAISNLPADMLLDSTKTAFVDNFTFSSTTYPGATNPNLDGKPVLVLAITSEKDGQAENSYSFLNIETLVTPFSVKDTATKTALKIEGYEIELKVAPGANNALEVTASGLKVDISGKIDKVTGAVAGHIPMLAADGSIVDSGVAVSSLGSGGITVTDGLAASDEDVAVMLDEVFGTD